MARPRKDQQEPAAVERIKNAFWELLEQNNLKHITVNMDHPKGPLQPWYVLLPLRIARRAAVHRHRGRAAYSKGLPLGIFYMLSNDSKALTEMLLPQRTRALAL